MGSFHGFDSLHPSENEHFRLVERKGTEGECGHVEIEELLGLLIVFEAHIDLDNAPDSRERDLVLDEEDVFNDGFHEVGRQDVFVEVKSVGFGATEDSVIQ